MKKYFSLHKGIFLVYLFVSILYALILAGTGFVFRALTEAALGTNFNHFILIASFSVLFLIGDSYFDYVPRLVRAKVVNTILHSLREDLMDRYLQENLQMILKENPAERTNKLVNQLEVIENSYLRPFLSAIASVFIFTFSVAGAFYLQPTLTLIMLVLCFLPFLAPIINQKILSYKKQESQETKKVYLSLFEDFSRNLSTIRLTNASPLFKRMLYQKSAETKQASNEFEKRQAATYAVSYGLSNIVYSGTWIIGGIFVFNGLLTIPGLIAMTTIMGTVAGPIQTLSGLLTEMASSKKVLQEFLSDLNPQQTEERDMEFSLQEPIQELSLSSLGYSVGTHPLFHNLNYQFKEKGKYAILGESGTGKSTLLHLIMGIFPPSEGEITVNAYNRNTVTHPSFYERIAYVPQKSAIFQGTIAQNVSMFQESSSVDETKMVDSLSQAGLSEWLNKQEQGIHTFLSASHPLSGGEERRLDLARALYRESDVIILDEPTSGLDSKNEQLIAQIIDSLEDKMVLVVTHSTNPVFLRAFHEILELTDGQLLLKKEL